ncbi:hypothetical protein A2W54_01855 [Candidatus Giovannonibacteria bacterium RIFCSPHIGHO2_02_43_13]|uniref:Uncharacterized protein n=1 Tax=Candidatus Giovannonibacteria bacterium RIFCSPHIGHO2_02_43_13 TaxID=1798330 RepID=A0A1F5WPI9_9BACT|nr:MAG: hypothetical protein A3E06_03310 [Candidatus Giovannonibacteria bacterium RIFCSPHIGHO2_12_FULL_44_42]OGF77569.1 MAG: hypothetical protein A2W54_01855 [Candidatus Giovannonibacteria bacterium RIFCSPHIGHO2_02_43_13]
MNKLFDVLEILGFPVEIDAKFNIHNGDIWNSILVKKSIKHAGNLITTDLPIPGHMVKFACTLLTLNYETPSVDNFQRTAKTHRFL